VIVCITERLLQNLIGAMALNYFLPVLYLSIKKTIGNNQLK
jgi:hypothetical protein